jgi:hypothetical protein
LGALARLIRHGVRVIHILLRKFTTRPVWWYETRRSYPIRDMWKLLPPIAAPQGPTPFAVLTTPRTFNDALWTTWSWLRFFGANVRPEIYVDGPLDDEMRRGLDQLLPGTKLFEARPSILASGEFPASVASFISDHPMGRKLGLYFLLQPRGRFLYSDSDVVAFAEPTELLQALATAGMGAHFLEEKGSCFSEDILAKAGRENVQPIESMNAGFLLIPGNSLSLDLAAKLLQDWQAAPPSWFLEQTVMACLLRGAPMTALPRDRYVLTNRRQFYWEKDVNYSKIVARHFTGTTRHVMYGKGLPWILRHLPLHDRV